MEQILLHVGAVRNRSDLVPSQQQRRHWSMKGRLTGQVRVDSIPHAGEGKEEKMAEPK